MSAFILQHISRLGCSVLGSLQLNKKRVDMFVIKVFDEMSQSDSVRVNQMSVIT